jgi:hypothetical protein
MFALRSTIRSTRVGKVLGQPRLGFPKIPVAAKFNVVARSFTLGITPKSSAFSIFKYNYTKIDKRDYSEGAQINGLTARDYAKLSDAVMNALYDALDEFAEENANHDVEYSVSRSLLTLLSFRCCRVFVCLLCVS